MRKTKKTINSLYIHIPFCKSICPYCDFVKFVKNQNFEDKYTVQILNDLKKVKTNFNKFKTIYLGGGTPSILSSKNLELILKETRSLLRKDYEFTIECNPEDITEDLLSLLKKYGVNRISLGIQSFNSGILKEIKRDYGINYFDLIELIKKYITNINVDFIYGFKNQTLEELKEDLNNFVKLDVDHVSIYSLIIDQNSIFFKKGYKEQDEEESKLFYETIVDFLNKYGYERYEVSNFARNKHYSKHNLNYWRNKEYLAIGLSSSGFIDNTRYKVSDSLIQFLNGERNIEKEVLTPYLEEEYFIMTNLRLKKGINLKEYKKLFNQVFLLKFDDLISELKKDNLIDIKNNYIFATNKGFLILDFILVKFFSKI